MVDQLSAFADEVTRVAREVGTEGKLGGQAEVEGVSGTWKGLTDNVNFMASNLTEPGAQHRRGHDRGRQRRPVAEDHRRRRGEILELKDTINTMVDQLSSFADEVTRVAREVGTEGKPRRPGRGRGRHRHVERPDRQRELHGRQPDRARCATSPRSRPRWPTATCRRRSRSTPGEILAAEGHHQHDGRPAVVASPTRSRASPARSAPRASSAARPRSKGVSGTWRTSPTT